MSNEYATFQAPPGSRLEQLAAQYTEAKAAADESARRFKDITDAIKVELTNAAPSASVITLAGPVPLQLRARETWRLDAKAMKAQDPETYVRWAVKSTSWVLTAVKP